MKLLITVTFASLVCMAGMVAASVNKGFSTVNIVLYQPDEVLGDRVSGTESLANFLKQLEEVCATFFAETTKPEFLDVVVIIRPGKSFKVWFVSSNRSPDDQYLGSLREKLEGVDPPRIRLGPVAVAISGAIAGAELTRPDTESFRPPMPQAWKDAASKLPAPVVIPDDIINILWPTDISSGDISVPEDIDVPEGFELQHLEPAGGRVARPKGWYYAEQHRSSRSLSWVISKEDPDKGAYKTGLRIQLMIGIEEETGQSPKGFVESFVEQRKAVVKVIGTCTETQQGDFTRICLESEEELTINDKKTNCHVQYSFFWNNDTDIVGVTIAGTPVLKWDEHRSTFEVMRDIILLDPSRGKWAPND